MIGEILGDYKIIEQIGQGTLGATYLAEHRFIKKQYVLKVLPEELCQNQEFLASFEKEVVGLASFDHPHIVKIHNISRVENFHFFVTDSIVDEQGERTNLAQYCDRRKEKLSEEELLSLVQQIASALDCAHAKGVIHQSLKLSNILLGKPGLHICLSDFGLAKIISPQKIVSQTYQAMAEELSHGKNLSQEVALEKRFAADQSFIQGYSFLAPEQKHHKQVAIQTDTYAFGVVVYYLIAEKFPEGLFEMPSDIAPEFHYDWDQLITYCLAQDARRRPTRLLPLLAKKRVQALIENPVLTPRLVSEEEKESSASIHLLQEALVGAAIEEKESFSASSTYVEVQKRVDHLSIPMETGINPTAHRSYSQALQSMLGRDPVVTQYLPEKKELRNIQPLPTQMITIQGGQFKQGSNEGSRDEMPYHSIFLDTFSIDVCPVTNEQFVRFLEYMGGEKDLQYYDLIRLKDSRINRSAGRISIESGYHKHPVVGVTWYGAVAYAKWVGKRLPTEAEWEIAAYGGLAHSIYPTGQSIEKNQANFFSSDTTPVMSYAPNGYGLYDMVGNVYEWCLDWYGYNYYEVSAQEPNNPQGPVQGVYRVLRGGCWKSLREDMRSSHRHRNNPGTVNSTYGFRCATNIGN